VTFGTNNLLDSFILSSTNQTVSVQQNVWWYNASTGNNAQSNQASGAYIFRPNSSNLFPINDNNNTPTLTYSTGPVVTEIYQYWADWCQQVYRIWPDQPFMEVEQTVGPIPIDDGLGKEVITLFDTSLNTDNTWWTDSQGLEFQQRWLNFRPTWNLTVYEPVSGNYFPVDVAMYIQDTDQNLQLSVVNDRSDGGSSLENGEMELMIHRRLLVDDGRGVGEPLNESTTIRTTKQVYIDTIDNSLMGLRSHIVTKTNPVQLFFGPPISSASDWLNAGLALHFTPLIDALPSNVELLSFEFEKYDGHDLTALLRFHNIFSTSENSSSATVDVSQMFSQLKAQDIKEYAVTGTVELKDVNILKWNTTTTSTSANTETPRTQPDDDKYQITLSPMQIRTFIVKFSTN